jgi:hypothetical protein
MNTGSPHKYYCDRTPSVNCDMARDHYEDPAIVWAYEVDPVKLGSHLETYNIYRPLFQTLRLCHKYGKSAPITGLLVEVLKMIEDEIFEAYVAESMPR